MARYKGSLGIDALLCTVFTYIIGSLLYLIVVNISILDPFVNAFKDFSYTDIYYAKGFYASKPTKDIVLVNIQHADRYKLAQCIGIIKQQQPAAMGIDVVFKERKNTFTDSILKVTLKDSKIANAYYFDQDSVVGNHPYFGLDPKNNAYINLDQDKGGAVIRNFTGLKTKDGDTLFSLPAKVALLSGKLTRKQLKPYSEEMPIQFTGGQDQFFSFDIDEVLGQKNIPAIKNSIILLGYLGTPTGNPYDIEDKHFTPLNTRYTGRAIPDTYGIVIHANILNMMINKERIVKVNGFVVYTIAFIATFLMIWLGMSLYRKNQFLYDVSIKVLQFVLAVILLFISLLLLRNNIYLNIIPTIAFMLLGLEMIDFYIYLVNYVSKHSTWKSRLL
ncbi:MAG: hypothetical protein CL868_05790 [Cytophagaceae bacterium]|nr:hypothetical protein [Cytophagaceae bacterium]|tara:strand:+ start:2643 stop:3806 length:1164 start_codon:yes stop_codon:yes gene_type:complete